MQHVVRSEFPRRLPLNEIHLNEDKTEAAAWRVFRQGLDGESVVVSQNIRRNCNLAFLRIGHIPLCKRKHRLQSKKGSRARDVCFMSVCLELWVA